VTYASDVAACRARVDLATRSQKRQVHWKNRQRMANDAATLENFNRGILTPGCGG
jgi:hypothetical protein